MQAWSSTSGRKLQVLVYNQASLAGFIRMAGTRVSSRSASRSSPRSSPASKQPNAKAKPAGTPLKTSSTPQKKSRKQVTSPYFANGKKKSGKAKGVANEAESSEDGDQGHSPSGMTETESDSSSDASNSEDAFDPDSDSAIEEEVLESDVDSDFLDDDDQTADKRKGGVKRKSLNTKTTPVPSKRAKDTRTGKAERIEGYESEDEDDEDDIELEEGQEIAGRIYPAPKTGQVPPGQISRNTFNFLKNLQIPERNDREWFRSHEPAFRQAEKEWQAFVGCIQAKFHEADEEVPILPPRDVIHRIYRDVRFSSDKTPYKRSFSMTTSRGGRKGIWACYHLSISPNGNSIIAGGVWQPGKNELASIRQRLTNEPQRFRDVINEEEFVKLFGPGKVHSKGKRQNVFGHDDQLKVAPKGIDKGHKDIDLLKLRSVAVVHKFTDEEVFAEDFADKIQDAVRVMSPFVHLLNDFVTLPATANEDDGDDDDNDDDN